MANPIFIAAARKDLIDALDQISDDERLLLRVMAAFDGGCPEAANDVIDALHARLGEVPAQGEEAKDGQAPNTK